MMFAVLSTVYTTNLVHLNEEIQADPKLNDIFQDLIIDDNSHPGYLTKAGRVFYKGRMVIRNSYHTEGVPYFTYWRTFSVH